MGMAKSSSNASVVTVSVTKVLAAASAYDVNDVMSEDATNGQGTDWDFAVVTRNGGKGVIIAAECISESESVTPAITLYLFNVAPTSELDDHAANTAPDAADLAKYVGKIDFPALESLGTTDSHADATPGTPNTGIPRPFACAAADTKLYGIAVTRTAFTQTAGDDLTFKLTVEQY